MNTKQAIRFMAENPAFFSRLGFCYDPPIQDEQGRPVVFSRNFKKYATYHKDMKEAGIKIHSCILHTGWVGVDQYDYSLCDEVLEALFSACGEEIYFIPRIKLNVPPDWCAKYPEDTFVYCNGPRTAEEIRSLAGTLRQDYLGYPSPHGYYQSGEYHDERPNVDSLIGLQSFSSKQWQKDAGEALRRLIEHIEHSKYAARILAYHIAYGRCGETILWGEYSGDYGINQLRNFYDFGIKKYGCRERLNEAWQGEIDRDHVPLPSPEARYGKAKDILSFYRSDAEDTICTDYDEFLSAANADALEYFAKIVKDKADKPVGIFYGYYMYLQFAQYAGHLALDKILDSPYIDFLASPVSYYRRECGDAGGEMTSTQSIGRKKLWMSEIDNRSHLCPAGEIAVAKDLNETKAVLWREVSKALAAQNGFWLMDLGGGWYDSPDMHALTEDIVQKCLSLNRHKHESKADVLFLTDEKGLAHARVDDDITLTVQDLHTDARKMGFWYDCYRLADVKDMELSQYKLIVLSMTVQVNEQDAEDLFKNIPSSATVVFCGACGILCNGKAAMENISRLTGISVAFEGMALYVNDPSAEAIREENNRILVAQKNVNGRRHIVNFARHLPELSAFAEEAGCVRHAANGTVTYGDSRFAYISSDKAPYYTLKEI